MEKGPSEIAKLTERISKDPKSKLFVPLAEEYKKTGNLEMAIAVLTEGLKNNPGYVTAKSFLGRLLLDKGKLSEAQKEFEEVIKAIPDNVLAQRKLGDIHALQGRAPEALQFFKAVLAVNPKDPELKALVADIEAGHDVREKIAGPKYQPAAGQAAAAISTPEKSPSAAKLPPVKPSTIPGIPPKPQAAPVIIPRTVDAEEPEEVLVFESLDEVVPAGVSQQPEATQDMFAEPASETSNEDAARMDDGLTGVVDRRMVDTELSAWSQPESGSDAGNSFFDSEAAPINIPVADSADFDAAAASERSAPVTEYELGSTSAGLDTSFFDSEPLPVEATAPENSELDVSAGTENAAASTAAGVSESSFFDSEPMQIEPQKTADALDTATEPAREFPVRERTETSSGDTSLSEALFFDVEPVETEEKRRTLEGLKAGEELTSVEMEVPAPEPGQESFVPEEASSERVLFDVEPAEETQMLAQSSDSGPEVAADYTAAPFGETVAEADDFTTDTLAELYIAQGFFEKAIEIYERMLADRPNSKMLKEKLANVRAMGSATSADEEQGTPVFFEAPGSPPMPSPQPVSAGEARQWSATDTEAKEYIPPPADDFESTAFDSGFAPVEYVMPEAPVTAAPSAGQELPVQQEEPLPASPKITAPGKEQTIAKLDNWLKNIMKEK
jgi:tetratricopeptide (TPR) repeat protein